MQREKKIGLIMKQRALYTLISLFLACPPAFADSFSVTIKAVDGDKKPVAKAGVSMFWVMNNHEMAPADDKPIVTDESGKAPLRADNWNQKRAALVFSADRKLGGIVGVSKEEDGKELTVTLGPTVRVKGKLECKELNFKPVWANTMIRPDGFRLDFAQNVTQSAEVEFVLPAGKYVFGSYGLDVTMTRKDVTVPKDKTEIDVGTIDLKPTNIAKLKGKTPPDWVIADARGAKADVKLADFKGKWVYIEFWGFW